jgi:hypothetical protein
MQFEINITPHDLKSILIDVAGENYSLIIKLRGSEDLIEEVIISGFDMENGILTLGKVNDSSFLLQISYLEVEAIEFESFYKYKGSASKVFTLE